MSSNRTLTFVANNLGRDVDLLCSFEKLPDNEGSSDQQPVCWRVIKLGPNGHQAATATYKANMASSFVPQTSSDADNGIGFENGENLSPGLISKNVGSGASVRAQLTPVLKIYATSGYQETELIPGEIMYPCVWSGDWTQLDTSTQFRVQVDPVTYLPKVFID